MIRTISLLLIYAALALTGWAADGKPARAKNVILLLADAGGIPTLNAASLHGYNAPQKLFVQSWEHVGLSDTSPAGKWVTDSAAGMTAIVTGRKTWNGVISQGPDGVRGKKDGTVLKTILEIAEEKGLSTGVMSNVSIADATPAACYGHANDRRNWGEIFLQIFTPLFGDGVDVVFGMGRKRIYEEVKKVGKDLDEVARQKGRPVFSSLSEVPAGAVRGLVVMDEPIALPDAAKKAIQMLSKNEKGYFLMIESDAHTDNPAAGLDRLVAFDKLIKELAGMVGDDTLLLFTADHSFDLRLDGGGPDQPILQDWEAFRKAREPGVRKTRLAALQIDGKHTGEEVLVAAKGPGAERVRGFMPNTRIFEIMQQAWGWK
ncbi:MAG: alkaline phosphatase [Acidobacteria bacterium]|nr:alkaline phosphatase [Acidobacteriota bacterium]